MVIFTIIQAKRKGGARPAVAWRQPKKSLETLVCVSLDIVSIVHSGTSTHCSGRKNGSHVGASAN